MYNNFARQAVATGVHYNGSFICVIAFLVLWTLFWKSLALWHAARKGQPWWFGIMLVVNTAGILEIVYLFLVLKLKAADLFSKKK